MASKSKKARLFFNLTRVFKKGAQKPNVKLQK